MGASLTLARGLMMPLVVSIALAATLLAATLLPALLVALAAADPLSIVVAQVQAPFRWH
jgi:hypothetical protein